MKETDYNETATTSHPPAETSDVEVELNIKMLDSQSHTLRVKKNMTVLAFKEQISSAVALPAAQQRLIFRGKVLKDEHLLSDYNVEDGHTLHLVARQPAQEAQPGSGDSNTNQRAPEPSDGSSRNRTGQISHSVVLGTFNLGEQNDNIVPDISRIIGAVFNSIGANMSTAGGAGQADQASNVGQGSISEQASQGGPIGATRASDGGIDQSENRTPPVQAPPNITFQAHPPFEFPPGLGATTLPSHPLVVPHSLVTLSEYMNRMDTVLSRMGANNQSSSIPSNVRHEETPPLRGLPNPEHLSSVIRRAQQLLTGHTTTMLSHLSGRLDGQQGIVDPSLRAQIQAEAYQTGLAVQHLGSLLLELGRTILTLQMGQSPADSVVNAGPAVYISSRGPNPLMVQPFPHQAGSLFGANPPIPLQFAGALGNANPTIGDISRHLNIHITAASGMQPVVARLSAGAVPPGQQTIVPNSTSIPNSTAPGESGAPHALPVGANHVSSFMHPHQPGTHQVQSNQATPGLPSRSGAPTGSDADADAARGVQHSSLSSSLLQQPSVRSSIRAEDTVMQQPELVPRSTSDSLEGRVSSASRASSSYQDTSMNALKLDDKPEAKATPIGLGAGGLQPLPSKRRPRTVKQGKEGDTSSQAVTQSKEAISQGQNILATLASQGRSIPSKDVNGSIPPLPVGNNDVSDVSTSNGRVSLDSMISQVLQTPGINDLIAGMSEPTTAGATPDVLSSMMGQIARNPALSNVLGQAMQAMDGKDIGGMLAGLGSSGGGNNLSSMIQQMLPVVSRSLGNLSLPPASTLDGGGNNQLFKDGVRGVESVDSLVDMFHKLVQDTADSFGQGAGSSGLVDELSNDEELVNEFVNFLSRSLRRPADS